MHREDGHVEGEYESAQVQAACLHELQGCHALQGAVRHALKRRVHMWRIPQPILPVKLHGNMHALKVMCTAILRAAFSAHYMLVGVICKSCYEWRTLQLRQHAEQGALTKVASIGSPSKGSSLPR